MATSQLPRLPAGERLRRAGIAAWSLIGLLILGSILVWVLFKIKIIFPPLVLALIIIYLLNPIVSRLEERRVSRTAATFIAYVFVLGSLTLLILAVSPLLSGQIDRFSEEWPRFKVELADSITSAGEGVEDRFGVRVDTASVTCLLGADDTEDADAPSHQRCDEVTSGFRDRIAASTSRLTELGSSVLEVLFIFVLGPLLALYLLIDLPHLQRDLLNLVPPAHREELADLGSKVGRTVGGFFRGQFLVALLVGVMAATGFAIIGLPFWLVIGAIAGFTNLIPLVGPFIGGGLGLLIGSVTGGGARTQSRAGRSDRATDRQPHHQPERDEEGGEAAPGDRDALDPGGRHGGRVLGRASRGARGGRGQARDEPLLVHVLGNQPSPHAATAAVTPPSVVPERDPVVAVTSPDASPPPATPETKSLFNRLRGRPS